MSEAPARRRLLAGLDESPTAAPPPLPETVIAQTARRHGFAESATVAAASGPVSASPVFRRERKTTGRTEQFNVRLKPETMAAIYAESNERDIPLGQVIEEAMAKLRPRGATAG